MAFSQAAVVAEKYRLARELGRGAAGAVWEAENMLVGRKVALKILHRQHAGDPEIRRRFLAEARASARVAHPNVVDVFDVGTSADGCPFIVMELCDGETLSTIIDDRGAVSVEYACELMLQVLAGLHAAHAVGLVHRDLKPDNIIVVHPRPDRPLAKVLDFGIAKSVAGEMMADPAGHVFGTPEYMAPEQARGEPVDARADIYASATILYELLAGRPPFDGETTQELLARSMTLPPVPLSELVQGVRPELDTVVLASLAKEPSQRPGSAAELLSQLAPFAARPAPSILPRSEESDAPLPLVSARSTAEDRHDRLELVVDSSVPPPIPLRSRK